MIDDLLAYIQSTIIRYLTCLSPDSQTDRSGPELGSSSGTGQDSGTSGNMEPNQKLPNPPSIVLNVEQFIRDVENRPAIWNRNYHCNKQFMEQTWDELSAIHKLPKHTLKTKWKGLRDNFRVEYKRIPRNENGEMMIPPETHDSKWTHYHSLLFLTEHMRHRQPKIEQDGYYFNSQLVNNDPDECEQTLVEPDLTNGLIRLPDDDDSRSPPPPRIHLHSNHNSGPLHPPECSSNDSALYSNSGSAGGYSASNMSNGHVPTLTIKRKRPSYDLDDHKPNFDGLVDSDDDYHYLLSLHPYMKQLNASQKLRLRTKIQKLIFKELYKEDLEESK